MAIYYTVYIKTITSISSACNGNIQSMPNAIPVIYIYQMLSLWMDNTDHVSPTSTSDRKTSHNEMVRQERVAVVASYKRKHCCHYILL